MDHSQDTQPVDEMAFAAVFEQYKNLVYRTAYQMLSDSQEAEDALQEVFMQVYRHFNRYDPAKGAMSTWLYRITMNHCLSRQRKKKLVQVEMQENLAETRLAPVEGRIESDETLERLLEGLSDKLRAVVILRYTWDLAYDEIAEILDIPMGTVKSRLNTALGRVQENLDESPTEEGRQGHAR